MGNIKPHEDIIRQPLDTAVTDLEVCNLEYKDSSECIAKRVLDRGNYCGILFRNHLVELREGFKKKPQTWAFCPTSADPPFPSELGPPYQITHF